VSATESQWRGKWKSSEFPLVSGKVVAALPREISENVDFPVRARIRYSSLSLYRRGETVDVTFEGRLTDRREIGGSNAEAPISGAAGGGSLLLFLKGSVANSRQVVSYRAFVGDGFTKIKGRYRSDGPFDLGTFSLQQRRR